MPYDVLIIGAGIIGLTTALRLKETNPDLQVAVLEKEHKWAMHQSGNNSGVIHSGIYYKPGSLKAINCINGYRMLLDFCNQEQVPYDLCGKLIIATRQEELIRLENLYQRGLQNGLLELKRIGPDEITSIEPYARGIAGIWVPYTGIIDYKAVCDRVADMFMNRYHGSLFLNEKVEKIISQGSTTEIITHNNRYHSKIVVNTAGLYSDQIALLNRQQLHIRILPFRGEYYHLKAEKKNLVKHLIYPVPDPAFPFMGVHFTRRINGEIEAGPNAVFAFKREAYKKTDFDLEELASSILWPGFRKLAMKYWKVGWTEYYRSHRISAFTSVLKQMIPTISKEDIQPGGSGVRAQACTKEGELIDDFLILESPSIIDVLNTPSPAATASLSIASTLCEKIIHNLESGFKV